MDSRTGKVYEGHEVAALQQATKAGDAEAAEIVRHMIPMNRKQRQALASNRRRKVKRFVAK